MKKRIKMQMRVLFANFIIINNLLLANLFADAQTKEIEKEIKKLEKLKSSIEKEIKKKSELLKKIKKERKELQAEKDSLNKLKEEIKQDRYKSLAKAFSAMDPEMAGEKLSKIEDPKKAAYILYNMKSRQAGAALNYVDPKRVSQIVKILTDLKNRKTQ